MAERFTPKMYIEWYERKEKLSIEDFGVAPVVVISWQRRTVESLARAIDGKIPERWFDGDRHPSSHARIHSRTHVVSHSVRAVDVYEKR